jgi:hypothetical protein
VLDRMLFLAGALGNLRLVVWCHGLAGLPISSQVPLNQCHHRVLWACRGGWAHITEKPIASAIFPWEAMTKLTSESAYPGNPCLVLMQTLLPNYVSARSRIRRMLDVCASRDDFACTAAFGMVTWAIRVDFRVWLCLLTDVRGKRKP